MQRRKRAVKNVSIKLNMQSSVSMCDSGGLKIKGRKFRKLKNNLIHEYLFRKS